ncbi:kinesin-like protein KIN-6 [Bidens hawaiensis]|uniref:kinesin-like protein KIN-6 n=1 Tax=Bidens hawaiensis TaxID=980011 RepID=UPI00404B1C91
MSDETTNSPPPPCPTTVRRNPPRRARRTPYSAAPLSLPPPSKSKASSAVRSFPIQDILSIQIPDDKPEVSQPPNTSDNEKLKVYLRIRPVVTRQRNKVELKNGGQKNAWPQNPRKKEALKVKERKKSERCLKVNDERSVMVCPPADARRTKSEVYEGFSCVFGEGSTQSEVYERMMNPLVTDFLKGKSGMLAAMGPSGSGKTHTVFGSTRQPGMVALALRQIFSETDISRSKCSRTFHLSMFEIYSERGKGEKIMDLSQEGGDLSMQQSNIKGLKEEVIHDVQQAESLIASGMLKRSTAMTNSNIQSSRSQCIINIRCVLDNLDEDQTYTAVLTIVDLAGAEREKKTGNQGARLLESNFINNTSMVFGLCLRSLLEHQRNPKKPLHKHFQNSMLTKYLRDFLEGKKRMALILAAKPGEEDYQDTSYLLRQASPFMNIKFESIEEQPIGSKRRTQTLPKTELTKRMKLSSNEVCMDDEVKGDIPHQPHKEEFFSEPDKDVETNGSSFQFPVNINIKTNKKKVTKDSITDQAKTARENHILLNLSKALWKVLKEYKNKLEASENEADALRHNLTAEKERFAALESELNSVKASCLCGKSNAQVSSHAVKMECIKKKQIATDAVTASVPLVSDCFNTIDLENQKVEVDHALCPNVVLDKQEFKASEERVTNGDITGCDNLESTVCDSELHVHGENNSSFVKEDRSEHGEDANAHVSSSHLCESQCDEKQDILDDTGISFGEVISGDLEKFEDQSEEILDLFPNAVCDKQELNEVEKTEAGGEVAVADEVSSSMAEVQQEHKQKENKHWVNAPISSSELEGSKFVGNTQLIDLTESPDQQLVLHEDVISSQSCNASKLPEVPHVQSSQPLPIVKPKRTLRPASSVMLKNMNILEIDDATSMPKQHRHGKRNETEDGRKRTQGNTALLYILKQNFRH